MSNGAYRGKVKDIKSIGNFEKYSSIKFVLNIIIVLILYALKFVLVCFHKEQFNI